MGGPDIEINSRDWWDWYFSGQWDLYGGREQTRYFMSLVLERAPERERRWIGRAPRSIHDLGGAYGDGVEMLARAFPNASVTGLDFSAPAIAEARKQYPDRRFEHSPDGAIDRAYDVIVTSNCLEHFADPFEVARSHLRRCGYLYIVLVPFEERQRHESHLFTFERSSFPDSIEGFTKLDAQAIETVERYWPGSQILTIYGSRRYLDEYN